MTDRKPAGPGPDLDALLAEARGLRPTALPDTLSARILADADAVLADAPGHMPARATAPAPVRKSRLRAVWAQVLGAIGGAPGLAGLAAATVAGLWIGIVPPAAVQAGVQSVLGTSDGEEMFDLYFMDSAEVLDFAQVEG